jgi:hypothetical protein
MYVWWSVIHTQFQHHPPNNTQMRNKVYTTFCVCQFVLCFYVLVSNLKHGKIRVTEKPIECV